MHIVTRGRAFFFAGMEGAAVAWRVCRNEKTPQQPTVRRRIAEAFPLRKASRNGEYIMPRAQRMIKKLHRGDESHL